MSFGRGVRSNYNARGLKVARFMLGSVGLQLLGLGLRVEGFRSRF